VERKRSKWLQTLPIGGDQLGRRQFLRSVAGLGLSAAGLALLDGCGSQPPAPGMAKETLETTTLKLVHNTGLCNAPFYLAEEFLKAEGFKDVQYALKSSVQRNQAVASGEANLSTGFAASFATRVDVGDPVVMLAGVNVGCFELFGTDKIQAIRDLEGKTVAVPGMGSSQHVFLASMLAYVGVNPNTDVTWVTHTFAEVKQLLAEEKIDAYLGWPPEPQELRAMKIGHVVVNTMMDKPWSQYFCCMATANREFAQKNPVATKRALRAILKGCEMCASEPERAARFMVDKGYTQNFDYALEVMKHTPFDRWREYDPEDTLRFFTLRLHEIGMIKRSPNEIIAQGTDWRFLTGLKQELPASSPSAQSSGLFCQVGKPS
jgi:NitT/TauT family transport system substrate-binding protein